MKILVCGGAGYIGSHTVLNLLERGHTPVVFDNLEKGHKEAVDKETELVVGDLRNFDDINKTLKNNKFDAVIDFAAYSLVGESVPEPVKYFENNFCGTLNLIKAMNENEVKNIVFSSTAATYGDSKESPIKESAETTPTNPYGESKLCVEKMLKWVSNANGLNYSVLRYFNVAGADVKGRIGEDHDPESHLIPLVLKTALGVRDKILIYGNDYDTKDGTCIRDYIHVTDLADAHILSLENIVKTNQSSTYNLGNGKGFSVMEIIETARKVTGREIKSEFAPRRAGDPATLVASSEKIIKELGWSPKFDSLEQIIETAWVWHKNNPNGF